MVIEWARCCCRHPLLPLTADPLAPSAQHLVCHVDPLAQSPVLRANTESDLEAQSDDLFVQAAEPLVRSVAQQVKSADLRAQAAILLIRSADLKVKSAELFARFAEHLRESGELTL